jgi:hypothetical protein
MPSPRGTNYAQMSDAATRGAALLTGTMREAKLAASDAEDELAAARDALARLKERQPEFHQLAGPEAHVECRPISRRREPVRGRKSNFEKTVMAMVAASSCPRTKAAPGNALRPAGVYGPSP